MEFKRAFSRLIKDYWGVASVTYIFLVIIISIFAYNLAPDKTKNANQMHLSIHSKPPGFKTLILIIPKKRSTYNKSINIYEEIPISDFKILDNHIEYIDYGASMNFKKEISLSFFPKNIDIKTLEEKYIINRTFILGTDKYGRDLLSRIIIGSRISISIGFISVIISLLLGVLVGGTAGYFGGFYDSVVIWIINVFWAIPTLLLVIAISIALGKGLFQVFIAVGLTMWVEVARVVRGQVKSTKEKLFIQAAVSLGFSDLRILFNHILPTIISPLIVISAANFASAILIESGLSFLGIGAQPPMPSWGGMVKDHFRYLLLGKEYLAILPGLAIMSLVLAFTILGSSLRDALDVRN